MTTRRKPVAATQCGALPRFDRIAAGIALGAMALTGCKNPFESTSDNHTETQHAGFDPTAGLASLFATTSIQTVAEPHVSYPLLTVAAMNVASRVHAATTPPAPPTPPPPTGPISTFVGGAMAITTPRPVRGGIRRVTSSMSIRTHR